MGIGLYSHDLALNLRDSGHDVTVLTTIPYYPWWKRTENVAHHGPGLTELEGISVHRAELRFIHGRTTAGRLLFELLMWTSLRLRARSLKRSSFDKVVAIVPSLAAGIVAQSMAKALKSPLLVILQDISSTGASESGMALGSLVKYLISPIERRIIRSAQSLAAISPSMIPAIKILAKKEINIVCLPNYDLGDGAIRKNNSRSHFGISLDDFVIIHSGSIAKKQNLENLVDAARLLVDVKIKFYLFGHGNDEAKIRKYSSGLANFEVREPVPSDEFENLLSCADLLVINERPSQISMALPSKLISYFRSGTPVLAAVPKHGATYASISGLAYWVEAGNPEGMAILIQEIIKNPNERMTIAVLARQYFESNLSKEAGRARYSDWIVS